MLDTMSETLRAFLEGVRAWVLEQPWLGFLHAWIADVNVSTIWAILVVSLAAVILLIGFWPRGRAKAAGLAAAEAGRPT